MEAHEETLVLAPPQASDATPRSVLDTIRAKRQEHAGQHTFDVDVPGHDGLVGLRLGPVSARQLSSIAERAEKSKARDRTFNITLDTVCAAVVCVLVREDADAPYDQLRNAEGEPVGLDEQLLDLLGLTGTTQRALLLSLYENANSPELSIAATAGELGEWATGVDRDTDEALVGESPAARR